MLLPETRGDAAVHVHRLVTQGVGDELRRERWTTGRGDEDDEGETNSEIYLEGLRLRIRLKELVVATMALDTPPKTGHAPKGVHRMIDEPQETRTSLCYQVLICLWVTNRSLSTSSCFPHAAGNPTLSYADTEVENEMYIRTTSSWEEWNASSGGRPIVVKHKGNRWYITSTHSWSEV